MQILIETFNRRASISLEHLITLTQEVQASHPPRVKENIEMCQQKFILRCPFASLWFQHQQLFAVAGAGLKTRPDSFRMMITAQTLIPLPLRI
jgi:hypothetical protein